MNFLIDTNILIPLEPASQRDLEIQSSLGVEFVRLVQESSGKIFVHPSIKIDLDRDKDQERKRLREALIKKYITLKSPPDFDEVNQVLELFPNKNSNDGVDHQLLAALYHNAVGYLVTEDVGIHKKARLLGVSSRVLYLVDAIDFLKELFDKTPQPPPAVECVYAHQLDINDSFFDSLKEDYDFESWFQKKCQAEQRRCYVIKPQTYSKEIAALCVLKPEDDHPLTHKKCKVLKMCTFKVSSDHEGNKYGELLLKSVCDYIEVNEYDYAYFTVKEKHKKLVFFAADFGFEKFDYTDQEKIMIKMFSYSNNDITELSSLDFHIKYGPFCTHFRNNENYIVPILPTYHKILFPEQEDQHVLWPNEKPCGNSIKKVYLSHSRIKKIETGDNLFFYRSSDDQRITNIGIVEETARFSSVEELVKYIGQRTVYSLNQLNKMCSTEVLAIKFRFVKKLKYPIPLRQLIDNNVLSGQPQSITTLGVRSLWLQKQIKM